MLGAVAALAVGFLFAAPAAHAQVTENSLGPINGVTCLQRVGGSYPEDGHFYYCGNNPTAKTLVLNEIKDIVSAKSQVQQDLSAVGHSFFVFDSVIDQIAYGASQGDPGLAQDQQDAYDANRNVGGQTSGALRTTTIWEKISETSSTYPTLTTLSSAALQYTTAHESGHAFDFAFSGSPSLPSTSAEFRRVSDLDREYMLFNASNGDQLALTYSKFLIDPNYDQELFAEEFAAYAPPTTVGDITGVRGAVITPYYACTMAYVTSIIDNGREPTSMEYPSRCRTNTYTINCQQVKAPTTTYPNWPRGLDVRYCGTATLQGANGMWGVLNDYDVSADPAFQALKIRRARFYFFRNPSEYDTYMTERGYAHAMPTHPREWGVTNVDGGNGVPAATAIFQYESTTAPLPINNDNGTAHHAGLWMDHLLSSLSPSSRISDNSLFLSQMAQDWTDFNALPKCSGVGSIFTSSRDRDGQYICSSSLTITVGGTPQAGNVVTLTVNDPALSPNPQAVSYTVQAGNTTTNVASGLATAINANANLAARNITATSSGAVVTLQVKTGNATTYSKTTTGTVTLTVPNPGYGTGGNLSTKYAGKTNQAILETAHPHIFVQTKTIFAEVTAVVTGNRNGTNQGYDGYVDKFTCMKLFVDRIIKQGRVPTSQELTNAGCPTQ